MDKHMVHAFRNEILSYRIRSARERKRARIQQFRKDLVALSKKENELYCMQRNLGWVELEVPVQKGWNRTFKLRDDVARSDKAGFFQMILDKINTVEWSYRKDFKIKARTGGKNIYVVREQTLLKPGTAHFESLKFSAHEKKYFHEEIVPGWKSMEKQFVFSEPWRFILTVQPNINTKTRIHDPEITSRLKQIDNFLRKHHYRKLLCRVTGS